MKKLGLLLMSVCLIVCSSFAVISCDRGGDDSTGNSISVTQDYIELSSASISMEVYTQYTLTATTNVEGEIVWTTSDAAVATVEDGVINALSVGSATITATIGEAVETCTVNVTGLSAFPILQVDRENVELVIGGGSISVNAKALYKGEEVVCDLAWESGNKHVVKVENGTITPVGIGSTTVTVSTVCLGEILEETIKVVVNVDEQIQVSKGEMNLTLAKVNETDLASDSFTFEAFREGELVNDVTFAVESSDENVATVEVDGKEAIVTAVGVGSCEINVYYDCAAGRIRSSIEVNVALSLVTIDEVIEIPYDGAQSTLDLASLNLAGDFEGIYYIEELVSDTNGKFTYEFAEKSKGAGILNVELHTSVAIYYAKLNVTVHYLETPLLVGETSKLPSLYEGDVTEVGFEEGDTVYSYQVTGSDQAWTNRFIPSEIAKISSFDYLIVEFSLDQEPTGSANSGYFITVWVGAEHIVLVKIDMECHGFTYDTSRPTQKDEHAADPCVAIYNEEGKIPNKIEANQKYYIEIELAHAGAGETRLAFNDPVNVRIGDSFFCTDAYYQTNIAPNRDNTPPPVIEPEPEPDFELPEVSQGDDRREMPTYEGDVIELGFPEGTEKVYTVVGAVWKEDDNTAWNNRIIMRTDPRLDYIKFNVMFSKSINDIMLWPAGKGGTFGVYTLSAAGATPSADADADRKIFIVDENFEQPTSFQANKLYTVYFYLNNVDTNLQVGAFQDATIYIANIECANGDVSPIEINIADNGPGESVSVYRGDVTEFGFAEGTVVLESKSISGTWNDGVYINTDKNTNCLTVNFSLSAAFNQGRQLRFYSWYDGANGWIASITNGEVVHETEVTLPKDVELFDADGNPVTEWEANKVYTLKIYHGGATAIAICVDETVVENGFSIYYDNNIIQSNDTIDGSEWPGSSDSSSDSSVDSSTDSSVDSSTDSSVDSSSGSTEIPSVSQGDDRHAMPTYAGDVTSLGFAAGTTVYELKTTASDGWSLRMIMTVDGEKDYVKFDVAFSASVGSLAIWPAAPGGTHGVYWLSASGVTGESGADANRKVFAMDADGYQATSFAPGKVYTVYVYLQDDETNVHFGAWANATMYVANIECGDGDVTPLVPVTPNIFTQDKAAGLPEYRGDVTALGFAEGTNVMVNEAKGSTWNDAAYITTDSSTKCLTVRFAYSSVPSGQQFMIHMWGPEIGWIARISDNKVWHDAGDSCYREVELLDADGNPVTELEANVVYTLKIYHDGATAIGICPIGNNYSIYYDNDIVQNNDEYEGSETPDSSADSSTDSSVDSSTDSSVDSSTDSSVDSSTDSSVDSSTDSSVDSSSGSTEIPSVSQGDDRHAMPTYAGDVTSLGFAAGTTVYELKTTASDGWSLRMIMAVDGEKDYVKFDVAFSASVGSLAIWPAAPGVTHGVYWLSASGVTGESGADANRKVFAMDADGYQATSFAPGKVYTIYVYLQDDETNVHFGAWENATMYVANIECGDGDVTPLVPVIPNIFTQDKAAGLPEYRGDVTALGFAEGTNVMVNEAKGSTWNDAAYITTDSSTKCLTVRFAYSSVPSGQQFMIHMWGPEIGWIARISDNKVWHDAGDSCYREVELLDADGNPVTELEANVVYTLKIYHGGATAIAICPIGNNYSIYYDNDIVQNNDEYEGSETPDSSADSSTDSSADSSTDSSVDSSTDSSVDSSTDSSSSETPAPTVPSVSQGDDRHEMPTYGGEGVELGFPEGTGTVYEIVASGSLGWTNRIVVQVDSTKDYVKLNFILTKAINHVTLWPAGENRTCGSYSLSASGYTTTDADANRKMFIVDENGESVSSLKADTLYTLYFYFKADETNVQLSAFFDTTIYVANIEYGEGDVNPVIRANPPIFSTDGGHTKEVLPFYEGDVTDFGFAAGTQVFEQNITDGWNDRAIFDVVDTFDYVDIDFAASVPASFTIWICGAGGNMIGGHYTLTKDSIPVLNGGALAREMVILDANGKVITSNYSANTVYTLRIYIEGLTQVQIASYDSLPKTLLYANVRFGNGATAHPVVQGDARATMPTYSGDVTALGFAAGTTVYEMVNATPDNTYGDGWSKRAILYTPATQDYVTFEFVATADIASGSVFHVWGVKGSPSMLAIWTVTKEGAIITNMDGTAISGITAGTHYLVHISCAGLSEIQVGPISGGNTFYFGNVTYNKGSIPTV